MLSDDEYNQMLCHLTGGLNDKDTKQTLPIQKKESLQKLWEIKAIETSNPSKSCSNSKKPSKEIENRNEDEDKVFDLSSLITPE